MVGLFGGYPYLRNNKDWPICSKCNNHMQLFSQINMSQIPAKDDTEDYEVNNQVGNSTLVQLFLCTNEKSECIYDCETWEPFSKDSVCRTIQTDGPSKEIQPLIEDLFPEKQVLSWQAHKDYPIYEERVLDNLKYEEEVNEMMDERTEFETLEGEKLYGWPFWVQGEEYPNDRKSGKQMELLLQLDSERNLPYMLGDSGIGHITISPDNKDEVAFGWACY